MVRAWLLMKRVDWLDYLPRYSIDPYMGHFRYFSHITFKGSVEDTVEVTVEVTLEDTEVKSSLVEFITVQSEAAQ